MHFSINQINVLFVKLSRLQHKWNGAFFEEDFILRVLPIIEKILCIPAVSGNPEMVRKAVHKVNGQSSVAGSTGDEDATAAKRVLRVLAEGGHQPLHVAAQRQCNFRKVAVKA